MEDIRKLLDNKKLFVGTKQTLKELKKGNVKKIILSSNAPEDVRKDIDYYKTINSEVEIEENPRSNEDIGALCKKPYNISILGVKK